MPVKAERSLRRVHTRRWVHLRRGGGPSSQMGKERQTVCDPRTDVQQAKLTRGSRWDGSRLWGRTGARGAGGARARRDWAGGTVCSPANAFPPRLPAVPPRPLPRDAAPAHGPPSQGTSPPLRGQQVAPPPSPSGQPAADERHGGRKRQPLGSTQRSSATAAELPGEGLHLGRPAPAPPPQAPEQARTRKVCDADCVLSPHLKNEEKNGSVQ